MIVLRKTWANQVKEKDGWKCRVCGSTERLQAHHIKPSFLYPECQKDLDNGVTLCKDCHQRQHCRHFAGFKILPVDGIDPDPEGRMEAYKEKRIEFYNSRRKRTGI